jgi:hypothetical protein
MAVILEVIQPHEVRDDQPFCSDGAPATEALCGVGHVNEERDVSLEDPKHRLEGTDNTSRFILAKVSNDLYDQTPSLPKAVFRTVRPGLQTGSDRLARSDPVRHGGGPPRSSLVQSVGAWDGERLWSTAVDWIISKVVICMIVLARQKSVCRGGPLHLANHLNRWTLS